MVFSKYYKVYAFYYLGKYKHITKHFMRYLQLHLQKRHKIDTGNVMNEDLTCENGMMRNSTLRLHESLT